jgi:hypothetical protein
MLLSAEILPLVHLQNMTRVRNLQVQSAPLCLIIAQTFDFASIKRGVPGRIHLYESPVARIYDQADAY